MSHLLPAYSRLPIKIVKGNGAVLYNSRGKKYIDFAAGIAVCSLGHGNRKMQRIISKQAGKLMHCSNMFTVPSQEKLAKKLCSETFADKVFFCSSGLEALECAIKIMRKYGNDHSYGEKNEIITFERGFHGRSIATISAGGNKIAKEGFEPLLPGFKTIKVGDIEEVKNAINEKTVGILVEPVQAEGGVYQIDKEFLKSLRILSDNHGILLCFDEVQCGYGRTGSFFHYQQIDVQPDILTCAKGIGGGFPLGACLIKNEIAESITPGTHGSTYGGNPLAMSVGNFVFSQIARKSFLRNVKKNGSYFLKKIEKLQEKYPFIIKEVRGVGLLLGIETKIPVENLIYSLIDKGLIVTKAGGGKVIRITPPLNITRREINRGIKIMDQVFSKIKDEADNE